MNWIDIKEKQPNKGDWYLVYTYKSDSIKLAKYIGNNIFEEYINGYDVYDASFNDGICWLEWPDVPSKFTDMHDEYIKECEIELEKARLERLSRIPDFDWSKYEND